MFDAFISYARKSSTAQARLLKAGLEGYARPWNKARSTHVFLDNSSLSAAPSLESSIAQALVDSSWLIVLLTEAAAASPWVNQEISWWLDNKDASRMLLVHVDGHVAWQNGFTATSTAVPPSLRRLRVEPRWVDMTWLKDGEHTGRDDPQVKDVILQLYCPIHGLSRGEAIAQQDANVRRAKRLTRIVIASLSALLVLALVSAAIAVSQRNQIADQATRLQARQLASVADTLTATDLQRSQLFAVAATRSQESQLTHSALLRSLSASPALRHIREFPAEISALHVAHGGKAVAVGLSNGAVYHVDPTEQSPLPPPALELGQPVFSVGISSDGQTIAATGGHDVVGDSIARFTREGVVHEISPRSGQAIAGVAVAPDGRTVATYERPIDVPEARPGDQGITILDAHAGTVTKRLQDPLADIVGDLPLSTVSAKFADDHHLVAANAYQQWARIRVNDGAVVGRGSTSWVEEHAMARGVTTFARNGRWYAHSEPEWGSRLGIWSTTTSGSSSDTPPLQAQIPTSRPGAVDVSLDGSWVAVSDSTGILLSQTAPPSVAAPAPTRLMGTPIASEVAFLDDSTRLISAYGSSLAYWDTRAAGRATLQAPLTPVEPLWLYGADYNQTALSLSPDGSEYALHHLKTHTIERGPIPGRGSQAENQRIAIGCDKNVEWSQSPVTWTKDGELVVACTGATPAPANGVRYFSTHGARWIHFGSGRDRAITVAEVPSTSEVIITEYDLLNGSESRRTSLTLLPGSIATPVAASDDGGSIAFVRARTDGELGPESIVFVDADSGAIIHEEPWTHVYDDWNMIITSGDAVVQFGDGNAELWHQLGREGKEAFGHDLMLQAPASAQEYRPVASSSGLLAVAGRDGIELYSREDFSLVSSVPATDELANAPHSPAFTDDGKALVVAYTGATEATAVIRELTLDPDEARARACATAGRTLTPAEWIASAGPDSPPDLVCE